MRIAHARDFLTPEFRRIKREVLREDPDTPINFHLSDIRNRAGPFKVLNDAHTRRTFIREMSTAIKSAEYSVITAFVDKEWMNNQPHWERRHPYHYMAEMLFERYVLFLQQHGSYGDIMPEARDKPLNVDFQKEFDSFRLSGLDRISSTDFNRRVPVSKLKFRTKRDNVEGLQLCDLLAYPSHQIIRSRLDKTYKPNTVASAIGKILLQSKYHRSSSGCIEGYGIKCIVEN
jgi:hypothetical protein